MAPTAGAAPGASTPTTIIAEAYSPAAGTSVRAGAYQRIVHGGHRVGRLARWPGPQAPAGATGSASMGEWGEAPPTFDRSGDAWGSSGAAFGDDDQGGGDQYIELLGANLWVAGMVNLGRFRRVSDFVNIVQGYMVMRDVVVLTRTGEATRLTLPEFRVLPDDVAIVGQLSGGAESTSQTSGGTTYIEKVKRRLVVLTRSHIIDGDVFMQQDGSVMSFVDATDPKFIPMSEVRVRWVSDRKLAARYPFALLQRSQILGVATEGIKLGTTETSMRRAELLKAQGRVPTPGDALEGDIPAIVGSGDPTTELDGAAAGAATEDDGSA
jgi:hypothetical protein